jgi:hypothetical protein
MEMKPGQGTSRWNKQIIKGKITYRACRACDVHPDFLPSDIWTCLWISKFTLDEFVTVYLPQQHTPCANEVSRAVQGQQVQSDRCCTGTNTRRTAGQLRVNQWTMGKGAFILPDTRNKAITTD